MVEVERLRTISRNQVVIIVALRQVPPDLGGAARGVREIVAEEYGTTHVTFAVR
jgi:hypothetical protein